MKKVNVCLGIIIFLLVLFICVISIKKFFDGKYIKNLDSILATNYVSSFVSFNKINETEKKQEIVDNITIPELNESSNNNKNDIKKEETTTIIVKKEDVVIKSEEKKTNEEEKEESVDDTILFDGLNEEQLVSKLEKNLKNELSGTAKSFVEFYKTFGLDPYLSVAIVLHETGCAWTCSSLTRECYNYGGITGGVNKYKDTNYACYSSKEEGISAYLNMLYNNYYSKGLITPELINPKYATSLEWASAINRYITKIKSS